MNDTTSEFNFVRKAASHFKAGDLPEKFERNAGATLSITNGVRYDNTFEIK